MAISFVHEPEVTYGAVQRLTPLIRRVVADNPSKFTYTGTGTYLVGAGEVAVIDPGPELEAHVDAVMAALDPGEHISHVFITHTHADHSPALRLLRERGVDAPAHGFGPHGELAPDDPEDRIVFGDDEADGTGEHPELRETADLGFVPDVLMGDGDLVEGGDWTIEAIHTPGHTSNHLCFSLHQERALFPGDHVMGWSTSVIGPPDGNLGQYLDSLAKLVPRDEQIYWPTHGPPITDPATHVQAFIDHRHQRLDQIRAGLGAGPATLVELVPRIYADTPKTLWRPAAATTYAHLLHLVEVGEVEPLDGEVRRRARWRLIG